MQKKQAISEQIYEILMGRIISLEYMPGQVIIEGEIAAEFSLSRTPVRHAFERLRNHNLLQIIPRYGAQVTPIDLRYMKSVFEAVREQEVYATKLAVQRMPAEKTRELAALVERMKSYDRQVEHRTMLADDAKFHETVIRGSENPCIIHQLFELHLHTQRFWHCYHHNLTESSLFCETLADLSEAIRNRDLEKADYYAKAHIDAFVDTIRQELL